MVGGVGVGVGVGVERASGGGTEGAAVGGDGADTVGVGGELATALSPAVEAARPVPSAIARSSCRRGSEWTHAAMDGHRSAHT